ncbi:MAG: cytochrome c [Terriglobales bacterium]|jgi:mono/diheme cytochrome c family protein
MKLQLQDLPQFHALALVLILLAITPSFAVAEGSAAGAGVFKAKCVTCHGPDGSGNTPVGKSLQTADLRSPEVQKKSDAELTQSVSEGKGNMPAFKGNITDEEIQSVLKYVRTLAAKSDQAPKKKSGN